MKSIDIQTAILFGRYSLSFGQSSDSGAKKLETSVSVISRYERDEMTPSIETAKKLANYLDTSVGYLLGETEDDNLLKDHDMISRLNDINNFSDKEKNQIYFTLDAVIHEIKNRRTYAIAK